MLARLPYPVLDIAAPCTGAGAGARAWGRDRGAGEVVAVDGRRPGADGAGGALGTVRDVLSNAFLGGGPLACDMSRGPVTTIDALPVEILDEMESGTEGRTRKLQAVEL